MKSAGENQPEPGQSAVGSIFPRRAAVLVYVAFLMLLLAGLEGVCRSIGAHTRDPQLRVILHDYGNLGRGDTSRFRFVSNAAMPYRLKPGFELRSNDGLQVTRHNSSGFRANEDFPPRTEGALRIICLGGSTTYGVCVADNSATYPASLERMMNRDYRPAGWDRVEVFNLGVGGYTTREVLLNLRLYGLPLEPDVVLIQCAVNDVKPRFYADFDADYKHFRKPLEPLNPGFLARMAFHSQFLLMMGYELGLLMPLTLQSRSEYPMRPASEAVVNLARNGPEAYRRNLAEAVDLAEKAGAQVWLLTQAHLFSPAFQAPDAETRLLDGAYRKGVIEHNEVVRDLAGTAQVGIVDLEREMPPSLQYYADPVHMTEEGNRVKARLIAECIRDRLPGRKTAGDMGK
jgi:lysophospholipase L1-like esterase